jgi:hypothetical protein
MRSSGAEARGGGARRRRAAGAALVALLAIAVQAPFFARGLSPLDEGSVLAIADALAQGDVLYRDRIVVVAPLTYESLGLAFRWLGADIAVARAFQAALFLACVLLSLGVLRRVAGEAWALGGALSLLALKPLGFPLWTIANYSQLGLVALLLVLWSLLRWLERGRGKDLVLVGFAGGLAFLAKQNLGAVAALAAGLALLAEWWTSQPRRLRGLAGRAGLALGGSLVPVCGMALRYAEQGALAAAWTRAIASMSTLADAWLLPFPPLSAWSRSDPDWGLRLFAYFPPSVVELGLAGGLDLSGALAHGVEWAVKLCYVAPLVAIGWLVWRWLRAGPPRRAALLACALFAAGVFASMLYRPDWAHLMNVWPVLHVAIVAALAQAGARTRAALGGIAGAAWLGAAAVTTWAFLALDWEHVRTERGELAIAAPAARSVEALLRWEAAQPETRRIAFLPAIPVFHFLAARPLPLAADMLVPGIFDAGDDERLARELAAVDRVVYATGELPWVRADAIDVCPKLSRALATQFRFARRITPDHLAFERAPRAAEEGEAHELWELARGAPVEHWLFQRVWAWEHRAGERRCIEVPWRVAAGDRVVATPMAHPSLWQAEPASRATWIDFELSVEGAGGSPLLGRAARVSASSPAEPWEIPLELPEGSEVALRFCSVSGAAVRAGWAEPRVERRP